MPPTEALPAARLAAYLTSPSCASAADARRGGGIADQRGGAAIASPLVESCALTIASIVAGVTIINAPKSAWRGEIS